MPFLIHALAFFHVENVVRVEQAVDVEETEEVYEEEQQQFVEPEPVEVQDLETNPESQPGKHQKHISQYFIQV